MPVKFIIAKGIGFAPTGPKFIPTHGFGAAAAPAAVAAQLLLLVKAGKQ